MIALPSPLAPLSRLLRPFGSASVQDAWPRATQSRLAHCLLLALLLHVWLVLMLGNAPPGTAMPRLGVWGALNVTLRGPAQDAPVAAAAPQTQPAGRPGTATSPRAGGTVRAPGEQPSAESGSLRRGDWAPAPQALPRLTELPTPPPAAPDLVALPPPMTTAPPPPPLPAADPAPTPAERRLGAAVGPAGTAPVQPLERLSPSPPIAARVPLPQALPDAAALTPLPPVPVPVPEAPAPAPVPAAVSAVAPAPPPPAAVAVPSLPAAPAGSPNAALRQASPAASPQALPGAMPAALPAGRPDAGPQAGHDVATAPSAPASAPRLNLELPRMRWGELSRQGGAGVLPLLPRPPELPDKLSRDIDKSAKADCRKAYQGLGVLAVVPLAVDAVRGGKDGACKW